jgi:hypothetical protein
VGMQCKSVSECRRKRFAHTSEAAAKEHLGRLLADPQVYDPERLRIYACTDPHGLGKHWHVGHIKKPKSAAVR